MTEIEDVKKIKLFMFNDLDTKIPGGGGNFMFAMVLCVYTEFWGRLLLGIPQKKSKECFESFFSRLGPCYENLLRFRDIYHEVRCGLVHSYMTEGNSLINYGTGSCGIEYLNNTYRFNILTYYEDFKKAVDAYSEEVQSNLELREKLVRVLKQKPRLA